MIDESKLSRKFSDEPLIKNKTIEKVSKEDLYELYYNQNISRDEICKYFGFSKAIFQKLVKEYNMVKSKMKREITKEELYQYYIIENHRSRETIDYFDISFDTLSRLCKKFGIDKSDMRTKNTHETLDKVKENK